MASTSGTTWSKAEILKLIALWGQEHIQRKLQECKRNQAVYEEIAKEMREAVYERTYQQCRDKIKKLKGEYKKEKDRHGKTGEGRSKWDFFDEIDAILGHRPATRPPIVVDTLESNTASTSEEAEEQDELDTAEQDTGDLETASLNSSTTTSLTDAGKSKKRKRSGASKQDPIFVDLLDKIVSAQSKSEEMILELEEKRMKMEERQMEREAQQRKEEREFQMQMMRMMMPGPNMHNFSPPQHVRLPNPNPEQSYGSQDNYHPYSRPFNDDI